jgi:hypothetical protein
VHLLVDVQDGSRLRDSEVIEPLGSSGDVEPKIEAEPSLHGAPLRVDERPLAARDERLNVPFDGWQRVTHDGREGNEGQHGLRRGLGLAHFALLPNPRGGMGRVSLFRRRMNSALLVLWRAMRDREDGPEQLERGVVVTSIFHLVLRLFRSNAARSSGPYPMPAKTSRAFASAACSLLSSVDRRMPRR